ncbi:class I SAM-dependent methyltransferase [Fodinibius sediminis]|uniref:O-Methyltransferase involved in polyketide biosynthesis n=1 Tax=Fodinibius sediminis TaxID=1214077 RepID=A0A521ED44_9BACT|nr:class I SAM-dependent methyltransferase [Fodinibius sediminis]SMO81742.1 O-Methyltransferase involved in polyketide biosynthesis [Fodinibius sediminis]
MAVNIRQLTGITETLLIPLMGRALETRKGDGILSDPKSLEIFQSLNYDFEKFRDPGSRRSMQRTTIRTAIIDSMVREVLDRHPQTTIVELGCGLNSRFERLDNGRLQWYDLDVPEVYEVWRAFFNESDRRTFLPCSAFEEDWIRQLKKEQAGPFLFISEASVIYFPERKVQALFRNLHINFAGSYYLFDSATPAFLHDLQDHDDALRYCSARLQWSIEHPELIREWVRDIEIIKTIDLEHSDHRFRHFYPPDFKEGTRGYRLNLARL